MRRRTGISRATACVLLLAALLASPAAAALRYDPRLRFRTISTPRFDIHFHQREETLARRVAGFVEEAAAQVDAAIGPAVGRVQVILVDQHDVANGWATPVPYNTIEITAASPAAGTMIGNTDDWLRLVFIHEYTHVAHLSRAGGWIGGLRRAVGRFPLLFPNLYQPLWAIEGIATWQESASTGEGRVPAGDFRILLEGAARAGRFEPLDRVNGGNVDWPSGATPYLYGAYFHDYLADRYGPESLRLLADETSRRLPYLGSRGYKKVFGRTLGELWTEFENHSRQLSAPAVADSVAIRLTHHGFNVSTPRHAADGRIFYSVSSPHAFPALMELRGNEPPRRVASRYFGNAIGLAGSQLVVDELDLIRTVGLQSDLYLVHPADGARRRLTREARARDPDVSRTGVVACVVQMSDRRALATFPLSDGTAPSAPEVLISEPFTEFASPRWAPDGRSIAAERRRPGEGSEIVLVDPADRSVRVVATLPGERSTAPAWTPDGLHLLFSSAVGREPFRVYRVELATGEMALLEGAGPSAQSPDVSSDGETLVFVGYTPDGYDLFSMPLAPARWTPYAAAAGFRPEAPLPGGSVSAVPPDEAYSPWRTLAPRFWTPTIVSDAGELVIGAATGSADALGRHGYAVAAGWSTRGRPDWQLAYAYDRWRPTLFAAVSDDTDPWREGELRSLEWDAGMLLRVARVRFSHTTLASLHVAQDTLECADCSSPAGGRQRQASLRLGWEFSTARTFGYSISAEEGGRISVTGESTRAMLGAEGSGFAATVAASRYWRVPPRHGAIALRGAAAGSWGDPEAARVFSAAGHGPRAPGLRFGREAVGLLRGFDETDVTGTRAAVVNLDYRVPLVRIDRGAGTLPVFVRVVHGALFVDAGNAWDAGGRWADGRFAAGAELSLDAVVAFGLPLTLSAGAAWTHDRDGRRGGFAAFGRIGRAF